MAKSTKNPRTNPYPVFDAEKIRNRGNEITPGAEKRFSRDMEKLNKLNDEKLK